MSSFNLILWFLEILDVIINNEYCEIVKSFVVIMIFTVIVNLLPQIN